MALAVSIVSHGKLPISATPQDWSQHPEASLLPQTPDDYRDLSSDLRRLATIDQSAWVHRMRLMFEADLAFGLSEVLSTRSWWHPEQPNLKLFQHPWVIERCREVQFLGSDHLHIFPRGHIKSTTITLGECTRLVMISPNLTGAVFSITKEISSPFVHLLQQEWGNNDLLKNLFPDRLYQNPEKEAPSWAVSTGLTIKRPLNFKDPTIFPAGLLDGTTTSKRLTFAIYDDCVNEKVVTNPEMIEKANYRWEMSLNLGTPVTKRYYCGTFYAPGDTYHHMIQRGIRLNFHSCYEINWEKSRFTSDGIPAQLVVNRDRPVLFSKRYLDSQEQSMGTVMFAVQMLGAPASYEVTEFRPEWFQTYDADPDEFREQLNVLILVDPANAKGTNAHSRTAMVVLGLGGDGNVYLLDGVLDRLNLAQRTDALFDLVDRWRPDHPVRYEAQGHHSDIAHIESEMDHQGFHFEIEDPRLLDIKAPKLKRIERLIPLARSRKLYMPVMGIPYLQKETNKFIDVCEQVLEREFYVFPNGVHFDFIDAWARLEEPKLENEYPRRRGKWRDPWRAAMEDADRQQEKERQAGVSWMRE